MGTDATLTSTLLDAVNGPSPWAVLGHLPQVPRFDHANNHNLELWATANVLDCAVALTCTHYVFDRLLEDDVPPEIEGPDRGVLTEYGYSATSTVPRLLIAQRLIDSAVQIAALLPRLDAQRAATGADPNLEGIEMVRARLDGWVQKDVLSALLSPSIAAREKFRLLLNGAGLLNAMASWYYVRAAIERWPASLTGRMAADMFARLSTCAHHLMIRPEILTLTPRSTWDKLPSIIDIIASTYPAAVRGALANSNAPFGEQFVAVFDPTCAVNCAAVQVIGPWLKRLREDEDASEFEIAVEAYWRARGRTTQSTAPFTTRSGQYTDFVTPAKGDGSWPCSVADVEYVVREMIVAGGIERAFEAPQELVAPTDGGWVWIRTPWTLPLALASDDEARDLHRRAPLIAWMIHCSSNPFAEQNIFGNNDAAITHMEKVGQSNDRVRRLREAMLDIESIVLPATLTTSSILPSLFPTLSPPLVAAATAMIYPIIKVARSRLE